MQILLRIVLIVKIILLSALVHAESEDKSLTDKGYRIELLIYQQPENDKFGNIQSSKYQNFLQSGQSLSQLDSTVAYTDRQDSSKSISSIISGLKRHSLPFIKKAWIVKLNRKPVKIPIDESITDADRPADALVNGISLHGALEFSNNLYVDLAANIQFEQLVSGNVVLFDECIEKRHLKLNKLYYLDNETIGIVLRVSQTDFIAPGQANTATEMTPPEQNAQGLDLAQAVLTDPIQMAQNVSQDTEPERAVAETSA